MFHCMSPTGCAHCADQLPDDIMADIEASRQQLEAVKEGVDYEGTLEVR